MRPPLESLVCDKCPHRQPAPMLLKLNIGVKSLKMASVNNDELPEWRRDILTSLIKEFCSVTNASQETAKNFIECNNFELQVVLYGVRANTVLERLPPP